VLDPDSWRSRYRLEEDVGVERIHLAAVDRHLNVTILAFSHLDFAGSKSIVILLLNLLDHLLPLGGSESAFRAVPLTLSLSVYSAVDSKSMVKDFSAAWAPHITNVNAIERLKSFAQIFVSAPGIKT
jgi:hypothetical protein